MIHFAIGTKAQFIKMAPLMHLLQTRGEPYHLLDLSQHGSITGQILRDFGLNPVITPLRSGNSSVETYLQAVHWLSSAFNHVFFRRRGVRQRFFLNKPGIVVVHGDTLSTLLGLYLAKAAGLEVALIEAGLTSHRLFDPFPEEWIRRHVSKRAHYLFAPTPAAADWLKDRGHQGHITHTEYNTGRDALALTVKRNMEQNVSLRQSSYGVVTLHRLETLTSAKRLKRAIAHIVELAQELGPLRFYIHPPTQNALRKYNLMKVLKDSPNIELLTLTSYPEFVRALTDARFILTDGGSIQEEASYLHKPCLILRERTERDDGLGSNARLSSWDITADKKHLLRVGINNNTSVHEPITLRASQIILDKLKEAGAASTIR